MNIEQARLTDVIRAGLSAGAAACLAYDSQTGVGRECRFLNYTFNLK